MGALPQGDAQVIDVDRGAPGGRRPAADARATRWRWRGSRAGSRHAAARGLFDAADAARVRRPHRRRCGGGSASVAQPPIDVVRSAAHEALAREVAERSITLVRDEDGLLPLRLPARRSRRRGPARGRAT